MAGKLNVEVVAPDRLAWSGEASLVVAKTTDGEIGIMSGHEPLLGLLVTGPVVVHTAEDEKVSIEVAGGFISVSEDHVVVLAETAKLAEVM